MMADDDMFEPEGTAGGAIAAAAEQEMELTAGQPRSSKHEHKPHKEHKEHKHKSKEHKKHKSKDKDRHKESASAEGRHRHKERRRSGEEVGVGTSDVESGEILAEAAAAPSPQHKHAASALANNADTDTGTAHDRGGTAAETLKPPRDQGVRASSPIGATQNGSGAGPSGRPLDDGHSRKRDRDHDVDGAALKEERHAKEPRHGARDRADERDRDRDRDRERERERRDRDAAEREKQRDREREREREHDREKERDRDRERERDHDRMRGRDDRHDSRTGERDDRGRLDRPRDDNRERDRARDRELRERERDRDLRERDRERNRERDRERDRDRDRGRDRDRDRERDRHRSDRDDGRGRDRERDKHGSAKDAPGHESPEIDESAVLLLADNDSEDEEARLEREREERRRRLQAIKEKHSSLQALNDAVAAPTAAALAARAAAASAGVAGPDSAAPSLADTPLKGGATGAAGLLASAAGTPLHSASPAAAAGLGPSRLRLGSEPPLSPSVGLNAGEGDLDDVRGNGGGSGAVAGDQTPEGERTSSSDSEFGGPGDGPVLDIFAAEEAADADSGAVGAGQAAAAVSREPPAGPETEAARGLLLKAAADTKHASLPGDDNHDNNGNGGDKADGDESAEDDMFAVDVNAHRPGLVVANLAAQAAQQAAAAAQVAGAGAVQHDSYDDAEGYYQFQVGEMLDGRYEVTEYKGKGVFSSVVRARDTSRRDESGAVPEVAIKVIRSNETMTKAAQLEQQILRLLGGADPENRKHCIRLLRSFEYRNHTCLVFEAMDMNLRDLTKKYGRNVGLNVHAVGLYSSQLLIALRHLHKCQVLHADIKPDNILVNARRTKVKICDFGSAMMAGENEVTPYLVSRFYRAPEVILGAKYDYAMDMWSVGCVIYELFTGKILFPGRTNNEMLKLFMDVKGPFTKKFLRRCSFADKHFELDEPNCPFVLIEEDPITKRPTRRHVPSSTITPKASFASLLVPALRASKSAEERNLVSQLADLLDKMMALEPEKRIDADSAMRHPFIKGFLPKKHEPKAGKGTKGGAGGGNGAQG